MLTTDPIFIKEQRDKTFNPALLFLCWFRTQMRNSRVRDKRVCVLCGSTKSSLEKVWFTDNLHEHWYYDKDGNDLCHNCYMKKYFVEYQKKMYHFKGKVMMANEVLRKGVCSWCNAVVDGITTKRTSLHHIKYDKHNPLKHTVEICNRCHSGLKKKHPDVKRICFDCGSDKTGIDIKPSGTKFEHWYFLDLKSDKFLCNKCYCKRKKRGLLYSHH